MLTAPTRSQPSKQTLLKKNDRLATSPAMLILRSWEQRGTQGSLPSPSYPTPKWSQIGINPLLKHGFIIVIHIRREEHYMSWLND